MFFTPISFVCDVQGGGSHLGFFKILPTKDSFRTLKTFKVHGFYLS